jgi:hypothetical protein
MNSVAQETSQVAIGSVDLVLQNRRDELYYSTAHAYSMAPLGYASDPVVSKAPITPTPVPPPQAAIAPAVWLQPVGDWQRVNLITATGDFSHGTDSGGVQAGLDGTITNIIGADAVVMGIVGGYTDSRASYANPGSAARISGPGIGVYGTYVKSGFSADFVTKWDFFDLKYSFVDQSGFYGPPGGAPFSPSIRLTNFTVAANVQYRFDLTKSAFFEPTAGFSYVDTRYDGNQTIPVPRFSGCTGFSPTPSTCSFGLQDGYSVRVQGGARFGTEWINNGVTFIPSLTALAYSDVKITGNATQNLVPASLAGPPLITPTDEGKVRGQVRVAMDIQIGNGFSMCPEAEVRFGNDLFAGGLRLNLRKQW